MEKKVLRIKKNGETLIITRSAIQSDGQIVEFEGVEQPGIGPPMHVHFKQEELIRVIKGKMRVKTPTNEFSLSAGEEHLFEAGTPHRFWNEGDTEMHYSGHVQPALNYEYFIEQIYRSANEADDDKPGPFDAAYLLTRYKSEMDILEIPKPVKAIVFPILLVLGNLLGKFKKFKGAPPPIS